VIVGHHNADLSLCFSHSRLLSPDAIPPSLDAIKRAP